MSQGKGREGGRQPRIMEVLGIHLITGINFSLSSVLLKLLFFVDDIFLCAWRGARGGGRRHHCCRSRSCVNK